MKKNLYQLIEKFDFALHAVWLEAPFVDQMVKYDVVNVLFAGLKTVRWRVSEEVSL